MKSQEISKVTGIIMLFGIVVNLAASTFGQAENYTVRSATMADVHIHHGFSNNGNRLDLRDFDFFTQRDLHIINFPMPVDRKKTDDLVSLIKREIVNLSALSAQSGKFRLTDDTAKISDNPSPKQLTVFLSIEYFHGVFDGNPTNVEQYRKMGIRSITIIDNESDRFFEEDHLTAFGKEVIRRMNEQEILVDISHLAEKHMIDVIDYSTAPVIASHSCARAVSKNNACLSDAVLGALKANGGYVFITFNRNDLFLTGETGIGGIERLIKHAVYITNILGSDHVGIGSDYQASGNYVPKALNENNTYWQIQKSLRSAGFSDSEIGMIMSGAFLKAVSVHH